MFRVFYIKKVTVLMLTGMQIAVIGGDARQLEVVRKLTELDAKLLLVGFEQLDHAFTGAVKEKMKEINFNEIDSVILPVPGHGFNGKVETIFSSEEVVLTEEMIKRPRPIAFFMQESVTITSMRYLRKRIETRAVVRT